MRVLFENGKLIKKNDVYTVIDIHSLNGLIVSKTILHPGKETGGHSHAGQEEVYQFTHGSGRILLDGTYHSVSTGDIIMIPDGVFHKVYNDSLYEDLTFVCVFDGKRSH